MAPSNGRGGDPAAGEGSSSFTLSAGSGRVGSTRRHPDDEARPAAPTPAARTAGERGSRMRVVPVEMRGKRAPADGVLEAVPTCGHHMERYDDHDTALGCKGGGRGLMNKCDEMREEVSRRGVPTDGFEESVARCGFRNPPRAQTGPAASCIPVAGRGGAGGRGHRDTYAYDGTSRATSTADPCAKIYDTGSIQGPSGSFTVNNVQVFAGYALHIGSFLEGPDSKALSVGDEVKCKKIGSINNTLDAAAIPAAKKVDLKGNVSKLEDQLREATKKSKENIQKAVKSNIDAAEAPVSEGKLFCVTHADVGFDTTAVREAVVKAMDRFKDPETRKPRVNIRSDKETGRDRDKKGLGTIGEEVKQLAQRASDSSLKPQDYEGGTFAVSNLGGPFGIRQFCAIINPPQSAILAIGSGNHFLSLGGHDDKKHALSVKMDNNGEDEISWKKEGAQPSDIHGSSTLDGSHAEFRTFSEVPDFVCSDRGGLLGSKKRKLNYISKMNYYLRADCVSDINPISNREARSRYSLRYEELKERSRDLAEVSVLLSTCTSIKSSGIDTVTQIFMDICGSTISLQKNLSKLDINMLSEAAFVRAGIKPKDFYSTFAGKILEPKRLLSCYEIPNDSTIRVNARLRGGCGQDRTWDDIIRFQQPYETVSLPPEDLVLLRSDGSAQQDPVLVKFLAALMQLRSRDVLTQLCRKHYSGTSYGGKITSKDILFDPDGNVRINSAPEKFTQESAKLDYVSIGKILDDSFNVKGFYPMHFYQLVDFLRYGPAVDCQSEAVIAFVTNHVSLISHYRRVSISEILVQLIERLHPDVVTALLAALDKFVWGTTVENVAAMKFTYYFHSRTNQGNVWVPYTNDGVSLLKFSNNFFKHHKWTSLDKLDAAFSLVMQNRNFIPRFLFTILVTLKDTRNQCPELIQSFIDQVVEMLGNNVIDLERG